MASPVGHGLAGFLGYQFAVQQGGKRGWLALLLCVLAAIVPDLDFVPGLLINVPRQFHHSAFSHSLGGAVVFTVIVSGLLYGLRYPITWRVSLLYFALYMSHVVIDCFSRGRGIALFWPLSATRYSTTSGILPGFMFDHSSSAAFLASLFSFRNLRVIGVEVVIAFLFAMVLWVLGKQK